LIVDEGGIAPRGAAAGPLTALDKEQRRAVTRMGIRIGALDLYMPAALKPEAMRWRAALRAAASGLAMPKLPPESSVVLPAPADRGFLVRLGFRAAGPQLIRVDMAERIAAHAHEKRNVDADLVTSLGLQSETVARLMRDIGFQPGGEGWVRSGRRRRPAEKAPPSPHFAALAGLRRG
jgi:ATP-dependent RNA helicase SUPV3L1/SUV3